ncbi:hypothetical protein PsorP6_012535 [Peronosclerospora sorghi]|uniref:Uncharacterized protein n=1 Tax=Peronosclerospora sorghi TaxID=230839 RepID=A0ACC0WFP0_9STRA|nr:hypothetical protein PsorP6_012535 [Peronosclerospora sorghi]
MTPWRNRVRAHVRALEGDGTSLTLERANDGVSQPESEESAETEDTNSKMEDDEESHFTAQDYGDC